MPTLTVVEPATEPVRFHLSLNVPDLAAAVAFYAHLFGQPPAKSHADYAKFDLADPPVVFSLVPQTPGPGATLSHLGLRVSDDTAIAAYRDRLAAAGICTEDQTGTVCGYSKQNKLWVRDPFGNFWEIYRVEEDVQPALVRTSLDGKAARIDAPACGSHPSAAVVWEHFVSHPLPDRIPHESESVDEVRLTGTFNGDLSDAQRAHLLAEAVQVLKPGGKVVTHGLMANREFVGAQPKLPGLAAMVARVPVQTEPAAALVASGLVGVQMTKYTEKAWFTHAGAELREVKLIGCKPLTAAGGEKTVLYKGPFARAVADGGQVFERGKRTPVPAAVWEQLRCGPTADGFLFFDVDEESCRR